MMFTKEMIAKHPIAYLRRHGAYGSGNANTMKTLKHWAGENNLLTESSIVFGIPWDNPEQTFASQCRYDACLVISPDDSVSPPLQKSNLLGGVYAVFTIPHTAEQMALAWEHILPTLTTAGCSLDPTRPFLERYSAVLVANHLCELCVPIH